MLSNMVARGLRERAVPQSEKFTACVTMLPDSANPETVTAIGCWWKPLDVKLTTYGGVNLQGFERIINVPAEYIACSTQKQIRHRDRVEVNGATYLVLAPGLRSVSSRWECLVSEMEAT
jgi:hypothetical protein